jgi:hypothetical protein
MDRILLEESCEILDSRRIPITASNRKEGPYPYYGANGIQDYVDDYIFDDELVLLAEDGGNFGSKERPIAYRVSGKCWVNNHAHVLKPKDDINVDYLCYSLMFYDTEKLVNGATRQKLTQAMMRKMLIPKRSISEQKKIVATLNTIRDSITKQTKRIKLLDNLIKARFVEMFKDCIESVKLEQVVTSIKTGKLDANVEKKDGKYPFFTCDAIPKRIDDYAFDAEAILISGNGSRVGHVHYYKGKFNAYQRTYVLSDFRHDIDLSYLKTYLENELRPYIARNKKGSAVPYITLPMLQNFKLPFPPLEKQKEFSNFVTQIDKSKFAVQKSLEKTQLLFDSLMQEYFG